VSKYSGEVTNAQLDAAFRRNPQTGEPVGPLAVLGAARMNMDAASKVRRIVRALRGPWDDFEAGKATLITEYGEDGSVSPKSARWAEFVPAYNELLAVRVPIECEQIPVGELWCRVDGQREPIDLSPDAMDLLEAMGVLVVDEAEAAA
jgi:hypothetical protein